MSSFTLNKLIFSGLIPYKLLLYGLLLIYDIKNVFNMENYS